MALIIIREPATYQAAPKHPVQEYLLDRLAGTTVTLPKATGSGFRYRFYVGRTPTSNANIIQTAPGDVADGVAQLIAAAASTQICAAKTKVTLNGSTTGGAIGSVVELVDMKAGSWAVTGMLRGSGTGASPFS